MSDTITAQAFAASWNHLPPGSVYTHAQFEDWMRPCTQSDVLGKRVLELGCGNGSMLVHLAGWRPRHLVGVDLGESVHSARRNMTRTTGASWEVVQEDLVTYRSTQPFDVVVCIGVLHHLADPYKGFISMLQNTRPGGKFHGWVYAHEGNTLVRFVVEPLRRVTCRLPWWITKYGVATPLAVPLFVYAKLLRILRAHSFVLRMPLAAYALWIGKREFLFFRHVVFDQLVTPQTVYIHKKTIESWLAHPAVDRGSVYVIMRNGNSWKFGGTIIVQQ